MDSLWRGLLITVAVLGGVYLLVGVTAPEGLGSHHAKNAGAFAALFFGVPALVAFLGMTALNRVLGWKLTLALGLIIGPLFVVIMRFAPNYIIQLVLGLIVLAAALCVRYTRRGERRNWHPGEIEDRLERVTAAHIRELEAERARASQDGQRSS